MMKQIDRALQQKAMQSHPELQELYENFTVKATLIRSADRYDTSKWGRAVASPQAWMNANTDEMLDALCVLLQAHRAQLKRVEQGVLQTLEGQRLSRAARPAGLSAPRYIRMAMHALGAFKDLTPRNEWNSGNVKQSLAMFLYSVTTTVADVPETQTKLLHAANTWVQEHIREDGVMSYLRKRQKRQADRGVGIGGALLPTNLTDTSELWYLACEVDITTLAAMMFYVAAPPPLVFEEPLLAILSPGSSPTVYQLTAEEASDEDYSTCLAEYAGDITAAFDTSQWAVSYTHLTLPTTPYV